MRFRKFHADPRENTEFAYKWSVLIDSHLKEGIHDPVKAYEYMNKFYIEEGNKRVSVLKYCDAVSVPGNVTRILPARTDQKENKIYYEFVDFYALSQINYIYFSKLGSFAKLQEAVGKGPKELWTDDDKLNFSSVYSRFAAEYEAAGGKKLSITTGDAFLAFLTVYGYEALCQKTVSELKTLVAKSWEEFELLEHDNVIDLKLDPNKEKSLCSTACFHSVHRNLRSLFSMQRHRELPHGLMHMNWEGFIWSRLSQRKLRPCAMRI